MHAKRWASAPRVCMCVSACVFAGANGDFEQNASPFLLHPAVFVCAC